MDVGDAQAMLMHVFDVVGPGIDEGHVFAGGRHMGPRVAADRAGAHEGDFVFAHTTVPDFLIFNQKRNPRSHDNRTGTLQHSSYAVPSGSPARRSPL